MTGSSEKIYLAYECCKNVISRNFLQQDTTFIMNAYNIYQLIDYLVILDMDNRYTYLVRFPPLYYTQDIFNNN